MTIPEADARRAHRVLQAVWVIVSAQHNDALARDVAALGEKMRANIDAGDWKAAAATVEECNTWLATMAGVVTARMQQVFSDDREQR